MPGAERAWRIDNGYGSVEVLNDLVGPRPLLGRDHQVDLPPAETIERVIGNATRIDTHTSKLVAPRQCRLLVLKHADGLPALQAGVADRHCRFPGDTTLQETRNRHLPSVRLNPNQVSPGSSVVRRTTRTPLGDYSKACRNGGECESPTYLTRPDITYIPGHKRSAWELEGSKLTFIVSSSSPCLGRLLVRSNTVTKAG